MAINDHELPPKSLKSINMLGDGLSYTRGEAKIAVEREAIRTILSSLKNGDIVDYHLRASNNRFAKGKARINRMVLSEWPREKHYHLVFAFELTPITG